MKRDIGQNIFYGLVEKGIRLLINLVSVSLMIRLLPTHDYGIIGIIIGHFVFLNFFNLALESIILKNQEQYKESKNKYLNKFLSFTYLKLILFFVFSLVSGLIFNNLYETELFLYACLSQAFVISLEAIIAPLSIFLSSEFKHKKVTKLESLRWAFNLILIGGLYFTPTLKYIAFKDAFLLIFFTTLWIKNVEDLKLTLDFDLNFYKNCLLEFSLWGHLIGVCTYFIYRIDTFILSFFVPIPTVASYSISLNTANIGNIIPGILAQNNSIALAKSDTLEKDSQVTSAFMRLNLYLSLCTVVGAFFFGEFFLKILAGDKYQPHVYQYFLPIIIGLMIVKSIAAPIICYINIKGNISYVFKFIAFPMMIFSGLSYFYAAFSFGALGVAYANVINSILWVVLILIQFYRHHKVVIEIFTLKQDIKTFAELMKTSVLVRAMKGRTNE